MCCLATVAISNCASPCHRLPYRPAYYTYWWHDGRKDVDKGQHELLDLFFLPEAPIHIQGQLKIAEEICTEAVAQRDAARTELKRQEMERQQEHKLMEQA